MARLVVLRFDDNEQANKFVLDMQAGPLACVPQENAGDDPEVYTDGRVIGLFGQPTMFCTCSGRKGRIQGFTRGQRWGWWVCGKCKKPTKAWSSVLSAVLGSAHNHLAIFLEKGTYGEMTPNKDFGAHPDIVQQAADKNETAITPVAHTNRGVQLHGSTEGA